MADVRARARQISDALTPSEWARAGGMAATVIALNVAGWGLMAAAMRGHYHITKTEIFGVGTGILAYTLGMRHAFDADHIAAIDNTTRKLVSEGKRPLSVGFFFSLGHSSVVFVLALLLNFGFRAVGSEVRDSGSDPAQRYRDRRHHGLGNVPVPHRRAQRGRPGLDREGFPPDAARQLQR